MAPIIGFSTGALANGDFARGLELVAAAGLTAVEISALREAELAPMMASLRSLPLEGFRYVSIHAPSKFVQLSEIEAARLLENAIERGWPIILHPDAISEHETWRALGASVCIENMDKRKPIGRTREELAGCFDRLPEASFCFDIGHARQIDPTMVEAKRMLRAFGSKLRQVHMSEVVCNSAHSAMSFSALAAFRDIVPLLPLTVPIILESVVSGESAVAREIRKAEELMSFARGTLPVDVALGQADQRTVAG